MNEAALAQRGGMLGIDNARAARLIALLYGKDAVARLGREPPEDLR